MWSLVRFRHDVDLLDSPGFIDLARKAVLAGEFVRYPRRTFLRIGIFVILSFEAERLVGPRHFQESEDLFERLAVNAIGFALIAGGGADMDLLRHLIQP